MQIKPEHLVSSLRPLAMVSQPKFLYLVAGNISASSSGSIWRKPIQSQVHGGVLQLPLESPSFILGILAKFLSSGGTKIWSLQPLFSRCLHYFPGTHDFSICNFKNASQKHCICHKKLNCQVQTERRWLLSFHCSSLNRWGWKAGELNLPRQARTPRADPRGASPLGSEAREASACPSLAAGSSETSRAAPGGPRALGSPGHLTPRGGGSQVAAARPPGPRHRAGSGSGAARARPLQGAPSPRCLPVQPGREAAGAGAQRGERDLMATPAPGGPGDSSLVALDELSRNFTYGALGAGNGSLSGAWYRRNQVRAGSPAARWGPGWDRGASCSTAALLPTLRTPGCPSRQSRHGVSTHWLICPSFGRAGGAMVCLSPASVCGSAALGLWVPNHLASPPWIRLLPEGF